jgi:hypothetical protein
LAYRIVLSDDVTATVAQLDGSDARYWNVSLALIASDPFERFGQYSERVIAIKGFPLRTYNYWITQQASPSGERIFIFTAESSTTGRCMSSTTQARR